MTPSNHKGAPPKTPFQRTTRLLKMATQLVTEEVSQKIKKTFVHVDSTLNRVKQAQILVQELGQLKGIAMKLGQILALEAQDYLPEEVCKILESLQNQASFMEFSLVQNLINDELGHKAHHFTELSTQPIAAASIGQVHSARLHEDPVAIKIQYPEIAQALHSDMIVLEKIFKGLTKILKRNIAVEELLKEFTQIFSQESDYLLEASYTNQYREKAASFPLLVVPKIYPEYCTSKVLTLSFEDGWTLPNWLRQNPPPTSELKEHYAELILELYTREFCEWGLVQTDPNLGNFLFRPDTRQLVLLDFGATKAYSWNFRIHYSCLISAIVKKDEPEILSISEAMQLIDPRESLAAKSIFLDLVKTSMRPMTLEKYDFQDPIFTKEMQALTRKLGAALQFSPPPKDLIFLHRKLGGVFNILKILGVSLDLRSYTRSFEKLASERFSSLTD